jgi:general secretion pathway protein G
MTKNEGFSLIEIMAALTILGIVVGLVAMNVTGSLSQAKTKSAKIAINTLVSALDEYRRDCNRYPSTEEGLKVLVEKPAECRNCRSTSSGTIFTAHV